MYRILHISDLHRSPDDPVDNHALLSGLDRDFDSHDRENPRIGQIDAVIVSGDVIQGVPLGTPDFDVEIRKQYETALSFLRDFAKRYIDSDMSRIIVVPGNHDVDWNTARLAMVEVGEEDQDPDLRKYLSIPHSRFRFCWRTRKLFYVENLEVYEQRFDRFKEFMGALYSGADLTYPLKDDNYHNLFELDDSQIVVAAFNSCSDNDCYNFAGKIPDGAIGKAYFGIKDSKRNYKLRVAAWHHSAQGPPHATDYMNSGSLDELAGKHFQLGFHGHQHKTEIYPQTVFLPTQERMTVISAGSLCVGSKELPPGELRQYNIVEIDDDYATAIVHVREMVVDRAFGPRRMASFGGKSFTEIAIDKRLLPIEGLSDQIIDAETYIARGEYPAAIAILEKHVNASAHARKLLLHAATEGGLGDSILKNLADPESISELIALVDELETRKQFQEARTILEKKATLLSLPDHQKAEILTRLKVNETIRNG